MKHFAAGVILFSVGIIAAVVLNLHGASCLRQMAESDGSGLSSDMVENLERNCFIVTNSYVYSLFATAAGAIIIGYWFFGRRRIVRE